MPRVVSEPGVGLFVADLDPSPSRRPFEASGHALFAEEAAKLNEELVRFATGR
jgi:hypothetical protein